MTHIRKICIMLSIYFFLMMGLFLQKAYSITPANQNEPFKILSPANIVEGSAGTNYTVIDATSGLNNLRNYNDRVIVNFGSGREVDMQFARATQLDMANAVILDNFYDQTIILKKKEKTDPDAYVTFRCDPPVHGTALYLVLNGVNLFDASKYTIDKGQTPCGNGCLGTVEIRFSDENGNDARDENNQLILQTIDLSVGSIIRNWDSPYKIVQALINNQLQGTGTSIRYFQFSSLLVNPIFIAGVNCWYLFLNFDDSCVKSTRRLLWN